MNNYTIDEVIALGREFDEAENHQKLLKRCIKESKGDTYTSLQKFFKNYKRIMVTSKDCSEVLELVFMANLEDMPLFINDRQDWKVSVVKWRLKLGK